MATACIARERPRTQSDTTRPRDGGGLTLDDLLVGVWEGLRSGRTAACPVCGGAMTPRPGSGTRAGGGRCADCGSELS